MNKYDDVILNTTVAILLAPSLFWMFIVDDHNWFMSFVIACAYIIALQDIVPLAHMKNRNPIKWLIVGLIIPMWAHPILLRLDCLDDTDKSLPDIPSPVEMQAKDKQV